jgi:hypothetical protein
MKRRGFFALSVFFGSLAVIVVLGRGGPRSSERAKDLMVGVKIYAHDGALPGLFKEWRELGVNSVFVSPELARSWAWRGRTGSRSS